MMWWIRSHPFFIRTSCGWWPRNLNIHRAIYQHSTAMRTNRPAPTRPTCYIHFVYATLHYTTAPNFHHISSCCFFSLSLSLSLARYFYRTNKLFSGSSAIVGHLKRIPSKNFGIKPPKQYLKGKVNIGMHRVGRCELWTAWDRIRPTWRRLQSGRQPSSDEQKSVDNSPAAPKWISDEREC